MKQSSKRLMSVLLAFVFILAAFVFFFDLVQPTYENMEALRSNELGEETFLESQTALVQQAQATLNTYQNEAQSAANIGLAMPSGEDVAGALAQIQGIATNSGITVESISVTTPQVQVQATAAGGSTPSSVGITKPFGSFTLRLTASGSYESFKNFLSEVETNIRIFDVESVSLEPAVVGVPTGAKSASSYDAFDYSITVAAYYQTK